MSFPSSCRIHPTAIISPDVTLGENVEVGAFAILEGKITVGDNCLIRNAAYLYGPLTMGCNNTVYTGAILGERPQHLRYNNEPTETIIGDRNTFREGVTVHRGTVHSMKTVIGSDNFFMVNSHVAHDCIVGNRVTLVNGALIGGHCVIGDNVILSGNAGVHQFIRVGRLAMLGGCGASTKDIPPFVMQHRLNTVHGINLVGMRRAGISRDEIEAVRSAFSMIYRQGLVLPAAIAKMDKHFGEYAVIQEMITFLQGCTKGINRMRGRGHEEELAA